VTGLRNRHRDETATGMTGRAAGSRSPARRGGLAGQAHTALRELSDRAHADGDARAGDGMDDHPHPRSAWPGRPDLPRPQVWHQREGPA